MGHSHDDGHTVGDGHDGASAHDDDHQTTGTGRDGIVAHDDGHFVGDGHWGFWAHDDAHFVGDAHDGPTGHDDAHFVGDDHEGPTGHDDAHFVADGHDGTVPHGDDHILGDGHNGAVPHGDDHILGDGHDGNTAHDDDHVVGDGHDGAIAHDDGHVQGDGHDGATAHKDGHIGDGHDGTSEHDDPRVGSSSGHDGTVEHDDGHVVGDGHDATQHEDDHLAEDGRGGATADDDDGIIDDGNNDGIDESLQPSGTPAGSFDDGDGTTGAIDPDSTLTVTIEDSGAADEGVVIRGDPDGTGTASVTITGTNCRPIGTLTIAPGQIIRVTCGSVILGAQADETRYVLNEFEDVTITVPEGATATITDLSDSGFTVAAADGGVTVTIDGQAFTVAAGSTDTFRPHLQVFSVSMVDGLAAVVYTGPTGAASEGIVGVLGIDAFWTVDNATGAWAGFFPGTALSAPDFNQFDPLFLRPGSSPAEFSQPPLVITPRDVLLLGGVANIVAYTGSPGTVGFTRSTGAAALNPEVEAQTDVIWLWSASEQRWLIHALGSKNPALREFTSLSLGDIVYLVPDSDTTWEIR